MTVRLSGWPGPLPNGKLTIRARDGGGKVIYIKSIELKVPANGYAAAELPLAELAKRNPAGPVEIDVTFLDPTRAGVRITRRYTLKNASQGGIIHDFEEPVTFSGYKPSAVTESQAKIVPGGAEGSKSALAITVRPAPAPPPGKAKAGSEAPVNSVLLHPALPGLVDRIELMVKGGDRPVVLQPMLIDSGFTGMWLRNYNIFWPEPIAVNWQDWRKVVIHAPVIPAHHGDKNRYFLFKPWYPLNLAFNATLKEPGQQPTEIRLDNIRVFTHIPAADELKLELAYPDETRIHSPGSPLVVAVSNYAAAAKTQPLSYELRNFQGQVAEQGKLNLELAPGVKRKFVLLQSLTPGIYQLKLRGGTGIPPVEDSATAGTAVSHSHTHYLMVLDAKRYFGAEPLTFITDSVKLRRTLGLMDEKVYLDWDNSEAVPYLYHYNWFENELKKRTRKGVFRPVPVVGFSADWAGPEAAEAITKGTYQRWIPNMLQVPARLIDWQIFIRECLREYKDRFDEWIFWENPDLEESPQGVPPLVYPRMLETFYRTVKLYRPGAKVIAGGFNFDKALDYLDRIPNPESLNFDVLAVQMNLGELSPEKADLEGFLDELNTMLKLRETKRQTACSELDWAIGPYVSPMQQAAYHARAAMILSSRGAGMPRLRIINPGFTFAGYGVFYRTSYGSSEVVQGFKPYHVPKPSYFALIETHKFLANWRFVKSVSLCDQRLDNNRAFIYRDESGKLTMVIWRTLDGARSYRIPVTWRRGAARDVFGFPVKLDGGLNCMPLPVFLQLPEGYSLEQLVHDLRTLKAADGSYPVILDLHLGETDSKRRAQYQATGKTRRVIHTGIIPGGRKVREPYFYGLTREEFSFSLKRPGNVLLRRRWYFKDGVKLKVKLNRGPARSWDLSPGQDNAPGVRESTFGLLNCRAGVNRVVINYDGPGNCAGYRLEPMPPGYVSLTRWGALNARQTKGEILHYQSAVGTPLRIGKQTYSSGIGAHAVSFIEYPLDGLFSRFEVTIGVDGSTEGRGSVVFRIFVDGKERANSGTINGFSKPVTLKVDKLAGAGRMILSVMDAGDGNRHDLANWVNGKFFLKNQ